MVLVAAVPFGKLIHDARHTFRTERFLMIEDGNLIFTKQTWGSAPERTVVKKLKSSTLSAKSTGKEIQILLNGKTFHRPSVTNDIIVSSANQTVFFTEYENLPPDKSGRPLAYPRLYLWTEKTGFEAMNPSGTGTSSPRLSADEQALVEDNDSGSGPGGTVVYDIKTKQTSPMKARRLGSDAVVNINTSLTIKKDEKSADDAYGQLNKIDRATGKSEPVLAGQFAGRVTAFDGSIWVLLKTGESYEVVRLSPSLEQILETVKVK